MTRKHKNLKRKFHKNRIKPSESFSYKKNQPKIHKCRLLNCTKADNREISSTVYVSGLATFLDEQILHDCFQHYNIAIDQKTHFSAVNVHLSAHTFRPRGDAIIRFTSHDDALRAVKEMNGCIIRSCGISVRLLDTWTQHILDEQIYMPNQVWVCRTEEVCGETSIWETQCATCFRRRKMGSSSKVSIEEGDWLCHYCLAANAQSNTACQECEATSLTRSLQ